FNLGVLVEKEIVVHTTDNIDGDTTIFCHPSVVSIIQSKSNLRREPGTSGLLETTLSPSPHKMSGPDISENHQETLVDFLRSHSPLPHNITPAPDNLTNTPVDKKWSILKVFRKRRKRRERQSTPTKLPEHTVSTRTNSGNNYIAISIPPELADTEHPDPPPPPQLPPFVSETVEDESQDPELLGAYGMTSHEGMKNLKSVTEEADTESLSTSSLAPRPLTHVEEATWLEPPPRASTLRPTTLSQEESLPTKGKEPDLRSDIGTGSPKYRLSPLGSIRSSEAAERKPRSLTRGHQTQQGKGEDEHLKATDSPVATDPSPLNVAETSPPKRAAEQAQPNQLTPVQTEQPTSDSLVAAKDDDDLPSKKLKKSRKDTGPPRVLVVSPPAAPITPPIRTSSKRAKTSVSERAERQHRNATAGGGERPASPSRGGICSNDVIERRGLTSGPRGSFAESLVTTASSPRVLKAQTATAYQSVPIVVRPPSRLDLESPLNLNFPNPPAAADTTGRSAEADLLSLAPPPPPHPASETTLNRRDRVRERKQRDIEKLRDQLQQLRSASSHPRRSKDTTDRRLRLESSSAILLDRYLNASPHSRRYLAGKLSDLGPLRSLIELKPPYLAPEDNASLGKKSQRRSVSAPILTSSSSASPVESPMMPSREGGTSANYRRNKERQGQEEDITAASRRVQTLAAEEREAQERYARQKLLRRYEKLKESRTRDMESRLHRLERNGEVLTRSLVTLIETLNQLMNEQRTLQQQQQQSSMYYYYHPPSVISNHPPRGHRRRGSVSRRSQSLRSRHSDNIALRSEELAPEEQRSHRHRPASVRPSGGGGEEEGEGETRRRRSYYLEEEDRTHGEELQEQLDSRTRHVAHTGHSYTSSSEHSNDEEEKAGDLGAMEPIMHELQGAAWLDTDRRQMEEGEEKEENEVFKLF
ncbi:uncharacterized protein GGS25DRAFT_533882, partial [Hypoxylon fragiforme]|uniref:uncharacterized protein n=1 Tax=Hypoxylon fragiforme TaxID=63214 RepID=UPI0020C60146